MAKKKIEEPPYVEASLKIPEDQFIDMLAHCIQRGNDLLAIEVPILRQGNPYDGFLYAPRNNDHVYYEEEAEKKFIADYKRWDNFNDEVYKTSFDAPNSTYRFQYNQQKWHLFGSDTIKEYKDNIQRLVNHMKGDIERAVLMPRTASSEVKQEPVPTRKSNKVFIVHGHNKVVRDQVELFVRSIGYEPIILCKQADMGDTIIEKIEREAKDVCFSIVIYTYCDDGKAKEDRDLSPRARQNVLFEHGFMYSHLGRKNVCALLEKDVEQPGDLQGVLFKKLDDDGDWRYKIAKEMIAAGLTVDMNKI